jgi:hypothetical protein
MLSKVFNEDNASWDKRNDESMRISPMIFLYQTQ